MGCCKRDFSPAMGLMWPPVMEPAGWVQLPNCGLAPAGRSGVGSWASCLDILDQTGAQRDTRGGGGVTWKGARVSEWSTYQWDKYAAGWLCMCLQEGWGRGEGGSAERDIRSFEKCSFGIEQPLYCTSIRALHPWQFYDTLKLQWNRTQLLPSLLQLRVPYVHAEIFSSKYSIAQESCSKCAGDRAVILRRSRVGGTVRPAEEKHSPQNIALLAKAWKNVTERRRGRKMSQLKNL